MGYLNRSFVLRARLRWATRVPSGNSSGTAPVASGNSAPIMANEPSAAGPSKRVGKSQTELAGGRDVVQQIWVARLFISSLSQLRALVLSRPATTTRRKVDLPTSLEATLSVGWWSSPSKLRVVSGLMSALGLDRKLTTNSNGPTALKCRPSLRLFRRI